MKPVGFAIERVSTQKKSRIFVQVMNMYPFMMCLNVAVQLVLVSLRDDHTFTHPHS